MKRRFLFLLILICLSTTGNAALCQIDPTSPTKKEMKKAFRQHRRSAPNRQTRKIRRAQEKKYFELLAIDRRQLDSINKQKARINKLLAEVEAGKSVEARLAALRAENDSLQAIMRNYVVRIDSLNQIKLHVDEVLNNQKDYYFNLPDFQEPKIYFYENQTDPSLSEYWKMSADLEDSLFITEAYTTDFHQFQSFTEKFDSLGSKVIEYIAIDGSDSTLSSINKSEVYRWSSTEEYSYSIKHLRSGIYSGLQKSRKFQSIDSMEILGERMEVLRFKDDYSFIHGFVNYIEQQSFYSKEYGLVRYVQFDEAAKKSTTNILTAIYTEEEWIELQSK